MTSFFALKVLKKKLDFPKLWHSGTLDPLASGCLLVAVWNYTKLLPYLEDTTKEYEFEVTLGGKSPSCDLWTPVTPISKVAFENFQKTLTREGVEDILDEHFSGEIMQVPPKYSAIRIDGKKAHAKSREGEEFEMKARKVSIYSITILSFHFPKVTLKANVSSGTYVRSIAFDLGQYLGCGAYVSSLRRTRIAHLWIQNAQIVDHFDAHQVLDDTLFFPEWSLIQVEEKDCKRLDFWMEISTKLLLEDDHIYFVKNAECITHVVSHTKKRLQPLRKI